MIRQIIGIALVVTATLEGYAQKKALSFQQLLGDSRLQLTQPLPYIIKWTDDEHYVELRQDDTRGGRNRPMLVEVKTGKSIPYEGTDLNETGGRTYMKD